MNKYDWKIKTLAKGIDPEIAANELSRIKNVYGSLRPEHIVNESRGKKAPLHSLFEWDDSKAAEHYRLQQARTIINNVVVTVVSNGAPVIYDVFEIVTTPNEITKIPERSYKEFTAMTFDEIDEVKQNTLEQLQILQEKLKRFNDFKPALQPIAQAINEVKKVSQKVKKSA